MPEALRAYLQNKKILILGFGREGRSSYALLRQHLPEAAIGIADAREVDAPDAAVTMHCGENYLDAIALYDLVLKTPGISFLGVKIPPGVEITCQTDLFLRFAPCNTIGVTGTKGKTTTSTLIYSMLKAAGIPAALIGNMGYPVFDSLQSIKGKWAVIELSSHQLEFMTASPHIAVLTNLHPEHLDHYNGFAGYAAAKLQIMRHQKSGDYFLYTADQDLSMFFSPKDTKATCIPISYHQSDSFLSALPKSNSRLLGKHNAINVYFAAKAAQLAGAPDTAIRQGVADYAGIAHRMEPVGTYRGITFYDDCIATIPYAVLCAVDALKTVDTLIFGGMDRGLDYSRFAKDLEKGGVQNLIALPDTGHRILDAMAARGSKKRLLPVPDMQAAVQAAYQYTAPGKICLLSPAASSYNVYRDFEEKGSHYQSLVHALGAE